MRGVLGSGRVHTNIARVRLAPPAPRTPGRPEPLTASRVIRALAGLAPGSQKRILAALKSLLTFCLKIGYCQFNVGAALTVRKVKNTLAERILPHEDVARIIEREDGARNHAMLRFLYESGCRVSELCGLRWRDVQARDAGMAQVTIFGKGDKTRHVLISKRMYKELTRLRGEARDDAPVFPSKTGKPLSARGNSRIPRQNM